MLMGGGIGVGKPSHRNFQARHGMLERNCLPSRDVFASSVRCPLLDARTLPPVVMALLLEHHLHRKFLPSSPSPEKFTFSLNCSKCIQTFHRCYPLDPTPSPSFVNSPSGLLPHKFTVRGSETRHFQAYTRPPASLKRARENPSRLFDFPDLCHPTFCPPTVKEELERTCLACCCYYCCC